MTRDNERVEQQFRQGDVVYVHDFTTGREIRPPMMKIALRDTDWESVVTTKWANHFNSAEKNQEVADLIAGAGR
jgi:hypothetical protein